MVVGTHILTVEDDERIRQAVKLALEEEGWDVTEAATGESAMECFTLDPPDVVLIDINLPGIDGFDVCRQLRRQSDVPIIMVTARADTHDVVAGLEAGADDYVTKPFAPKELSARIRAMLRRSRNAEHGNMPKVKVGDLEISPEEGVVTQDDAEVHLTKTEFKLLCELASQPGKVFSREVLLERVWGYDYFGDGRLVDVHIRRLRTKVEPDPASPRYVVTSRGLGYKLQP
jgi:DNA-binding response OmpR family regulator